MGVTLNDCCVGMAQFDRLLRSEAMRDKEAKLQQRMAPGTIPSRLLGMLSMEREAVETAIFVA